MKKFLLYVLTFTLLFTISQPVAASASEAGNTELGVVSENAEEITAVSEVTTEVEYLENGDYLETTIVVYPEALSVAAVSDGTAVTASTSTSAKITATKTVTYKNASDEPLWAAIVTGTFFYVYGSSSTCIDVSGSATSYNSGWKITEVSTAKSGNTARCIVSATRYFAFIPLDPVTKTAALACDVYGNLT